MVKYYNLNTPGSHKVWYQSHTDRSKPSLVVFRIFWEKERKTLFKTQIRARGEKKAKIGKESKMRTYLSFHKLFDTLKLSFPKYPKDDQARVTTVRMALIPNFVRIRIVWLVMLSHPLTLASQIK